MLGTAVKMIVGCLVLPGGTGLPAACDAQRLRAHLAEAIDVNADRQDGHGSLRFSDGDETVLVLRASR